MRTLRHLSALALASCSTLAMAHAHHAPHSHDPMIVGHVLGLLILSAIGCSLSYLLALAIRRWVQR